MLSAFRGFDFDHLNVIITENRRRSYGIARSLPNILLGSHARKTDLSDGYTYLHAW